MDDANLFHHQSNLPIRAIAPAQQRRETRNNARGFWHFPIVVMLLTFVGLTGCRGSRPFSQLVKNVEVTTHNDVDLSGVEAPQQRLAGAKTNVTPRTRHERSAASKRAIAATETEVTVSVAGQPDQAKPTVRRTTSRLRDNAIVKTSLTEESPTKRDASPEPRARKTRQSLQRDLLSSHDRVQRQKSDPKQTTPEKAASQSSQVAKGNRPVANHRDDEQDLLDALSEYPPEVRREALRRLLASSAKKAEKTKQPVDFTDALQDGLDNLPQLPTATGKPAAEPATRLASNRRPAKKPAVSSAKPSPPAETSVTPSAIVSESATSAFIGDQSEMPQPAASTIADVEVAPQPPVVVQTVAAGSSEVAQAAPHKTEMDTSEVKTASSVTMDPLELDDRELYKALVQKLAKAPRGESDADRASRLIKLRYLTVLSGDVDSAVEKIEGMSKSEQEFLRHQLLGLWTMVDPSGHPVASRRITTALPQLREATKFAAAATDSLEVRSLAFCTEIESYGQIKPFPGNRFDAGQQVILYCEIENFTADQNDEGFQTHLQGSYDIFNDKNEKIVSQLLPADQQNSANYLRDYFIAYQMHLPKQLGPGTYRLQLTMEDMKGKKYGQASIPLEIAK